MQNVHVDVYGGFMYNKAKGGDSMATKAQIRANVAYNRRQDSITIRPSKEDGAAVRAAAVSAGQSLQGYIMQAVRERMEREKGDKIGT